MIPYPAKFVRSVFSSVQWHARNDSIHLTFDDGPHPTSTEAILKVLNAYNVRGTFFLLGKNIARLPDLVRAIRAGGHTVANHSYDHTLLLLRSRSYVLRQIQMTTEAISALLGHSPKHFRPPYGYFRPTLIRDIQGMGHELVMWDVDSLDWRLSSASLAAERVIRTVRPGSIVLLHDNDTTAPIIGETVKRILDTLLPRYRFSALVS